MKNKYMDLSFEEAMKAFENNDVPIGAVIVKDGEVIAKGYNNKENSNSIISHAEINAIIEAEKYLNNWRLNDCDLYVTLDPCPMCASAIKQARIKNVYSAMENKDTNYTNIIIKIFNDSDSTNSKVNYVTNLDVTKSSKLLSDFFIKKRK